MTVIDYSRITNKIFNKEVVNTTLVKFGNKLFYIARWIIVRIYINKRKLEHVQFQTANIYCCRETSRSVAILLRRAIFLISIMTFSNIRFRSTVLCAVDFPELVKSLEIQLFCLCFSLCKRTGKTYLGRSGFMVFCFGFRNEYWENKSKFIFFFQFVFYFEKTNERIWAQL